MGEKRRGGFFAAQPPVGRPFRLFSPSHLAALTGVAAGCAGIAVFRDASPRAQKRLARALTAALWGQEVSYHVWRLRAGTWTLTQMLPLHACSVLVWLGPLGVLGDCRLVRELNHYLGFGGATQALLTPDLGDFGFPHYRFVQFFVSHGLLVALPVYQVFVEGFRPTWASLVRTYGVVGAYALVVFFVNRALGSNYLYVNHKPATASPLDPLPAWPGYLPAMAGLVAGAFVLLQLPFEIADAARRLRR